MGMGGDAMLRSLDIQRILLHSKALERIQGAQQQGSDVQQRYCEEKLKKQRRRLKSDVVHSGDISGATIDDQAREDTYSPSTGTVDGETTDKKAHDSAGNAGEKVDITV